MKNPRETGVILPRYYGLRINMPRGESIFVTPMHYALAQLLLESPSEIRLRLEDWAEFNSQNPIEVKSEFVSGVQKKEGTKNVLNFGRRTANRQSQDSMALRKVKAYGNKLTAEAKSKGKGNYHAIFIPQPNEHRSVKISHPGAHCECPDASWGEVKGRNSTSICTSLAALDIALAEDEVSGLPQNANITGLYPSQRKPWNASLPFSFNFFKPLEELTDQERQLQTDLTGMLIDYYVEEKSSFEISKHALENPSIFSPESESAILDYQDIAKFSVMRQREKHTSDSKLSRPKSELYGSVKEAIGKIESAFEDKGYVFAGYGIAFKGTKWETIARQFRRTKGNSPFYSLVVGDVNSKNPLPPLIIRYDLREKAEDWINSNDPFPELHPLSRVGKGYESVHDGTRMDAWTTVILPHSAEVPGRVEIPISGRLRKVYDKIKSKG